MRRGRLRALPAVKVGDEVTRTVRDAIMSGIYVMGERLSVSKIASSLMVSTMPVREAIVALTYEGLIEAHENRGFQVAQIERQDLADIFLVHAFLATTLAERAVELIDDKTISRLERMTEAVDKLAARGDDEKSRSAIETYNYSFHRTINKLVDAPRLHWFLRSATRYVPRHIYETTPAWTQMTVEEHPKIVEAFKARDVDLVRSRVHAHVEHAGQLIWANLEERNFWSEPEREAVNT